MREWLIRKLGGVPAPEEGIALLVYEDQEGPIEAHVEGGRFEMIDYLGGVPLPKAGEGQIVVGPCVKRLPVRKHKEITCPTSDGRLLDGKAQELLMESAKHMPSWNAGQPESPIVKAIREADPTLEITTVDLIVANLCDTCNTTVQECRQAVKEIDSGNNTIKCDRWRDL